MTHEPIRFTDGAAYERYMGVWSQLAAAQFLAWLAPARGWRWLDVGCGSGAFSEMVAARYAPAALAGIDPAEAQLAFARTRPALQSADLRLGNAMAQPFADSAFDAAVMPLVIAFVPEPHVGVAEMRRVVRPGGTVAAYQWEMETGGFPYTVVQAELRALGVTVPQPASPAASGLAALRAYWEEAGLSEVETCVLEAERTYADFAAYWDIVCGGTSGAQLRSLAPADAAALQARLRAKLPADAQGRITYRARANAVKGRVPR
jgi:ubiquinone/menaquinone biosynthesis C-methylase UbiE